MSSQILFKFDPVLKKIKYQKGKKKGGDGLPVYPSPPSKCRQWDGYWGNAEQAPWHNTAAQNNEERTLSFPDLKTFNRVAPPSRGPLAMTPIQIRGRPPCRVRERLQEVRYVSREVFGKAVRTQVWELSPWTQSLGLLLLTCVTLTGCLPSLSLSFVICRIEMVGLTD